MRTGLILGGTGYLQDLLLPMNLSDQWLKPLLDKLDSVKRQGWLVNDVYALQNLMESFLDFEPLTPQLRSIGVPTMILNGEFDFLTPRALHETLRVQIPDSSLVIIPEGLSRLHAGKGGVHGRPAGALRRESWPAAGKATRRSGSRRKKPAASSSRFPPATTICAPFRCKRPSMSEFFGPLDSDRPRAAAPADARRRVPDLGARRVGEAARVRPAGEARMPPGKPN